jgi:3-deoxy-7-phosphoheptulonate synthase
VLENEKQKIKDSNTSHQKTKQDQSWCGYSWRDHPVTQTPTYASDDDLYSSEVQLQQAVPVVEISEIEAFTQKMARLKQDNGFILQVGDCSETFRHSDIAYTTQRISLFCELHRLLQTQSDCAVITMGRMAGQFAKPRSKMFETINGVEVSSYFGDVVNSHEPDARDPDPERLLVGYQVAYDTVLTARMFSHAWSMFEPTPFLFGEQFFVCHEAYFLPYEQNLLRYGFGSSTKAENAARVDIPFTTQDATNTPSEKMATHPVYATSAHMVWIGERTRNIDGAHIAFAKTIMNPIGVKIGPKATVEDLIELIEALNPGGIPGRLSFIFRLGHGRVETLMTEFATGLIAANKHNHILWLCDPMHGNTKLTPQGIKTRCLLDIQHEIERFFSVLHQHKITPNGLHLEVTPHKVHECVDNADEEATLKKEHYLSTCDPRLNADQVVAVVDYTARLIKRYVGHSKTRIGRM